MNIIDFLKKIFNKRNEIIKDIVSLNDVIQLPNRDDFKDDIKRLELLDKYKKEYSTILSSKRYLISNDLTPQSLRKDMEINISLLLNIYLIDKDNMTLVDKKRTKEDKIKMMVQILKLKLCQNNINKIESDTLTRLIALKEIYQERRYFLSPNKKSCLTNEINKLSSIIISFMTQKHAINIEVENYLKDMNSLLNFDISSDEEKIITERKRILLEMLKLVMPEKIKELEELNLSPILELAYLERELEIYVYNHKQEVSLLEEELKQLESKDKSKNNRQSLLEKIYTLELKYKIFNEFGRNIITQEQLYNLYKIKFEIFTIDICNHQSSLLYDITNNIEYKCYEEIIMKKIENIVKGKNIEIQNTFKDKTSLSTAIKLIMDVIKDSSNNISIKEILKDPILLSFILSFDKSNGLEQFFKTYCVSYANIPCYYRTYVERGGWEIDIAELKEKIPLDTIYTFGIDFMEERLNTIIYKLNRIYNIVNANEKYHLQPDNIYKLPEGITGLEFSPYQADRDKVPFLKKIIEFSNTHIIETPSSLQTLNTRNICFDGPGLILNEGLIELSSETKIRVKEITIPSTLKEFPQVDFTKLTNISFSNYQNSQILNNEEELTKLISNLFCLIKTGNKRYHRVSNYVKEKQRLYHQRKYSTFCDPDLFDYEHTIYEYEVVPINNIKINLYDENHFSTSFFLERTVPKLKFERSSLICSCNNTKRLFNEEIQEIIKEIKKSLNNPEKLLAKTYRRIV